MKMTELQYAIVDIETTGGNASTSRITEIAVIIHDGQQVVDRWESLVNPGREIPYSIVAFTGISQEMVCDAPTFGDIAPKIASMLAGRIFVAHNVNFDYSFIRHELQQAGITWSATKLCTVRAARKIVPNLASYSLGNLCKSLNITIENRHRAGGDANATAILLAHLLNCDCDGIISKMVQKTAQDQRFPPNLPPEDIAALPEKPGIYYFYNQLRKVVYVGKAINLKKRVHSHFTGNSITPQRQNFLRDIHGVSYEVCATELIALVLECSEIKKLWPVHNRALKKFEPKFGLYRYEARNGYHYLAIAKAGKLQGCVEVFNLQYDGINLLREVQQRFGIDSRFCNYGISADGEFIAVENKLPLPVRESHNAAVDSAIMHIMAQRPTFAIVDKGRNKDELSCLLVENGHFRGMGHIPSDVAVTGLETVREYITPYQSNQYIMQLINDYAITNPAKVIRETAILAD